MIGQSSGVKKSRLNVGRFEKCVVGKNFFVRSAGGQEFKKVRDTKTHAADAGPATALGGINRNSIEGQHDRNLSPVQRRFQH